MKTINILLLTTLIGIVVHHKVIAQDLYGVEITRIEGQGNGGLVLDFTTATEDSIVQNYSMDNPTYQAKKGPIEVKIIDPIKLAEGEFTIKFISPTNDMDSASWELVVVNTIQDGNGNAIAADTKFTSNKNIATSNEQFISELGISITIHQAVYDIDGANRYTDTISSTLSFDNEATPWLTGINDRDENSPFNWIRAGTTTDPNPPNDIYNDYLGIDDTETYENILGGWWSPWRLVADELGGPIGPSFANTISMPDIADVHSVDIVFTSDTNKWTRCPVIEMQESTLLSEGAASKSDIREGTSVNKLGNPDNSGTTGMGWFPGYAIDLETGERLNMAFGEDSHQIADNGRDMIWNPSQNIVDDVILGDTCYRFGGKHYIYVFNNDKRATGDGTRMPSYDEGTYAYTALNGSNGNKIKVWRSTMWTGLPLLATNETLLSTDARIRLRVAKPYENYTTTITQVNASKPLYKFSTIGLNCAEAKSTDTVTTCGPYTWMNGTTYTTNNNKAQHILIGAAINGCDSIITLNLTINTVNNSVTDNTPTLIANANDATYQWLDCNNGDTIIVGQTNKSYTATQSGSYAVVVTQHSCIDSSECVIISSVGISENGRFNNVTIYPNPNKGIVNIDLSSLGNVSINVTNLNGELIFHEEKINTNTFQFELNSPAGIYFVEITSDGESQNYKLILKQSR